MSELYYRGRHYKDIPGSWNDLKPEQLVKISGLLHSRISVDEAQFRILLCLLEVHKHWRLAWHLLVYTNWEKKTDFLADARLFIEFMFAEKVDLTRQLLPVIKIPYTLKRSDYLYGPPDKCNKMVFMEFIKAETYYLQFRKHHNNLPAQIDALNKLVAVLYRFRQSNKSIKSSTWNGDLRELYNDNSVKYRADKIISRLSLEVKYAIMFFYMGSRSLRESRYPNVFSKGSGSGGNWIDALRSMAGGALQMEKLAMIDADLALYDLNKSIQESSKKGK